MLFANWSSSRAVSIQWSPPTCLKGRLRPIFSIYNIWNSSKIEDRGWTVNATHVCKTTLWMEIWDKKTAITDAIVGKYQLKWNCTGRIARIRKIIGRQSRLLEWCPRDDKCNRERLPTRRPTTLKEGQRRLIKSERSDNW